MQSSSLLIVTVLLVMLATYVICGIPFGLLLGRFKGTDPRTVGSKNIGATNVFRSISFWAGGLTAILDMLKGFLCTFFGVRIISVVMGVTVDFFLPEHPHVPHYAWVSAFIFLAAVFGHIFSPYLKFRGGKGIAVGFGAALGFSWQIALGLLVVWALCTVPTRYVSVGSIASAIALPFLAFFIYYPVTVSFELPLILVAITVVWAHRNNLHRLKEGAETPFSLKHGNAQSSAQTSPLPGVKNPAIEEELELKQAAGNAAEDPAKMARHNPYFPKKGTGLFFGSEPGVRDHIQRRISEDSSATASHNTENTQKISDTYKVSASSTKEGTTRPHETDSKNKHD